MLGRRALVHNSVTEIELNIVPWNLLVWTHISLFSQALGQGVHSQNKHLKDHFLLEKHPPIQVLSIDFQLREPFPPDPLLAGVVEFQYDELIGGDTYEPRESSY